MVGSLLVKLIGAVYKIPLGNILSNEAYVDFNTAYNVYNLFLTIATAGLPVALSKTVSEANALGRQNQVDRVFSVALKTFLTLGLLCFFAMSLFPRPCRCSWGTARRSGVSGRWLPRCCACASWPPSGAITRATPTWCPPP